MRSQLVHIYFYLLYYYRNFPELFILSLYYNTNNAVCQAFYQEILKNLLDFLWICLVFKWYLLGFFKGYLKVKSGF